MAKYCNKQQIKTIMLEILFWVYKNGVKTVKSQRGMARAPAAPPSLRPWICACCSAYKKYGIFIGGLTNTRPLTSTHLAHVIFVISVFWSVALKWIVNFAILQITFDLGFTQFSHFGSQYNINSLTWNNFSTQKVIYRILRWKMLLKHANRSFITASVVYMWDTCMFDTPMT